MIPSPGKIVAHHATSVQRATRPGHRASTGGLEVVPRYVGAEAGHPSTGQAIALPAARAASEGAQASLVRPGDFGPRSKVWVGAASIPGPSIAAQNLGDASGV